jgi:hypothetical protein
LASSFIAISSLSFLKSFGWNLHPIDENCSSGPCASSDGCDESELFDSSSEHWASSSLNFCYAGLFLSLFLAFCVSSTTIFLVASSFSFCGSLSNMKNRACSNTWSNLSFQYSFYISNCVAISVWYFYVNSSSPENRWTFPRVIKSLQIP